MVDELLEQCGVLLPALEIVELVDVGSQVPDYGPAVLSLLQEAEQENQRVHVGALADIDDVFVLDQSGEDLEEGSNVEQLGTDVQVGVSPDGEEIVLFVKVHPMLEAAGYPLGEAVVSVEDDDLVLAGDLVLGDDFHDYVLVDVVALVVEDDYDSEEVQKLGLLVQPYIGVVGQVDDVMYDAANLTLLDQLFVVLIHLLVEVYSPQVEL